LKSKSR